MAWSSWGPGHPAANGLGPDTTRRSFTWYGPAGPAPAAGATGSSRTLASSGKPAVTTILDLIYSKPTRPCDDAMEIPCRRHGEAAGPGCRALRGVSHGETSIPPPRG